jgi:hypothetical protein
MNICKRFQFIIFIILFSGFILPLSYLHADGEVRWEFESQNDYTRSEVSDIEVPGRAQLTFKPLYIANDIPTDEGTSYGVSVADFNGDSHIDIYVPNLNLQNKLWFGDGLGGFINSDITGDTGSTYGSTVADIDNDGDIDIYTLNQGQNKLWINDGTGIFTSSDITGDLGGSTDAVPFDADNDGDLDLYVVNFDNDGDPVQNRLWINDGLGNGGASFTESNLTNDTLGAVEVIAHDIDNDGDLDLYVATFGQNKLWINDGLGNGGASFTESNINGDIGNAYGVAVFDANGDGISDLYSSNVSSQNFIWINDGLGNGGASFTQLEIPGDDDSIGFSIEPLTGDYDQDGDDDIYIPIFGGQNIFFTNDGTGIFNQYTIPGDEGDSYEAVFIDPNEDGLLDIYVTNFGQNKLWINQGRVYSDTRPYIQPINSVSVDNGVNSFRTAIDTETQGSVGFQVSNDDGVTWYYHDGTAWVATTDMTGLEVNSSQDVNDHIADFDTRDGNFLWRAYLVSDGNQSVILNNVRIVYDRSNGGGSTSVRYICKDQEALNYNDSNFGRHNIDACEYEEQSDNSENEDSEVQNNDVSGEASNSQIQEALTEAVPESQCPYFNTYQKKGSVNNEVKLIQAFLTELGFYEGQLDSIYGPLTQAAIDRFQAAYAERVLDPWGLTTPTGRWYQSTRNMANELAGCDEGSVTLDNGVVID